MLFGGLARYPLFALISAVLWGVVELFALQRARLKRRSPDRWQG